MSSILDKIYENIEKEQYLEQEKQIKDISDLILQIKPHTCEYRELVWLFKNKDKILKNRKLIDILG